MARLKEIFKKDIVPQMMSEKSYKNRHQVPQLVKIIVNMGVGEGKENMKILESAAQQLAMIAGQKPVITRSKKAIATFKLREGMPIGCKVTMRGNRMYEFFDRLVNIALPRVRDFKGVPGNSFDGRGNYTLGIQEHIIFPEVDYDKVEKVKGMNITIVTTAGSDDEARLLLKKLGMPFRN
jgi:large subunit ribosomal protein L5